MTPSEIRAKIKELSAKQHEAATSANDADLTLANTLQGEINAWNEQLDIALDEQQARAEAAVAIGKSKAVNDSSFLAQCFGGSVERFKSEFVKGFSAAMVFPPTPLVVDPAIPTSDQPYAGVLDTLATSTTAGDVKYFRLVSSPNKAAQWLQGDGTKAEGERKWEPATASLAYIAEWVPVTKTAVSDYGQIEGILRNELLADLKTAQRREALIGSKTDGIKGILNTSGIQIYNKKSTDNIYDSIRRMITLARITGRVIPQYVGLSPLVAENMDLLKNDNGNYLRVNDGNRVWSLQIIEDEFMTTMSSDSTPVAQEGVLVYAGNAATWYTKEQATVELGLIESQFIENAFTLLGESRNALAVKRPAGFVYLASAV